MSRPFDPRFPSSHLFVDPCSALGLSLHPPVGGSTKDPNESGVYGIHCADGTGVLGESGGGWGVAGISQTGEGVHGETRSDRFAAVTGISRDRTRNLDHFSAGVWGTS